MRLNVGRQKYDKTPEVFYEDRSSGTELVHDYTNKVLIYFGNLVMNGEWESLSPRNTSSCEIVSVS